MKRRQILTRYSFKLKYFSIWTTLYYLYPLCVLVPKIPVCHWHLSHLTVSSVRLHFRSVSTCCVPPVTHSLFFFFHASQYQSFWRATFSAWLLKMICFCWNFSECSLQCSSEMTSLTGTKRFTHKSEQALSTFDSIYLYCLSERRKSANASACQFACVLLIMTEKKNCTYLVKPWITLVLYHFSILAGLLYFC